jgi:hypothetical protein
MNSLAYAKARRLRTNLLALYPSIGSWQKVQLLYPYSVNGERNVESILNCVLTW